MRTCAAIVVLVVGFAIPGLAQDRLPPIPADRLTDGVGRSAPESCGSRAAVPVTSAPLQPYIQHRKNKMRKLPSITFS